MTAIDATAIVLPTVNLPTANTPAPHHRQRATFACVPRYVDRTRTQVKRQDHLQSTLNSNTEPSSRSSVHLIGATLTIIGLLLRPPGLPDAFRGLPPKLMRGGTDTLISMGRAGILALFVATQSVNGLVLTSLSVHTTPIKSPLVKMHAGQSRHMITGALTGLALVAALQGPLPVQALDNVVMTQPSMVMAQPSVLLADADDFQAKEAAKQAKARAAIEARRVKSAQKDEISAKALAARESEKAERMVASGSALAKNTIAKADAAKAKSEAAAKAAAEGQEAALARGAAAEESVAQTEAQKEADKTEAVAAATARTENAEAAATAAEKAKADKIAAYNANVQVEQKAFEEGKAARAAADKAFLETQAAK